MKKQNYIIYCLYTRLTLFIISRSSLIVHRLSIKSLFLLLFLPATSQNLLPDGGFEKLAHNNCVSPDQGFKKMQFWYPLNATPDLFERSCPFDEKEFVFWDESIKAHEGSNYAGLWARWNSNGSYSIEGIATKLAKPLEAGRTYFFEMYIFNQGTFQGLGSLAGCTLEPEKHLDLYLSPDSIKVLNDFGNGTASTNARLVATLNSEDVQSDGTDDWTLVTTCFEAKGGEQFFGIIMPLGTFGALPACVESQSISGVFRSFYYNLDATSVTELSANILEQEIIACEGQRFEVDLMGLFEAPFLKDATFVWEDGQKGKIRSLSEIKDYTIIAQLDCDDIPLQLKVVPQTCQTDIYIPNAFSPNADGHNDLFQVMFANETEIRNFRLFIFDRWGNSLFQTSNPAQGWDGKSRNQSVAPGIYLWFISYDFSDGEDTKRIVKSGDILILR